MDELDLNALEATARRLHSLRAVHLRPSTLQALIDRIRRAEAGAQTQNAAATPEGSGDVAV